MSKYLVTGGSGFIGTNLVEFYRHRGDEVLNVDIAAPRCRAHQDIWLKTDILDVRALAAAFEKFEPTHVCHLAARTDLDGSTIEDYQANTQGVRNLIDVCSEQKGMRRVLFASSRLVCRIGYEPVSYTDFCPTTLYGESKVVGEKIVANVQGKSWTWSIFRPTSIWGPWFGAPYRNFFDAVRRGLYLHPADLRVKKSFGYVGNAVYEIAELMDRDDIHQKTFYIGDYEPIDVMEFAREVAAEFGVRKPYRVPVFGLKLAARIGDFLGAIGVRAPLNTFRLNNLCTPMIHSFDDLKGIVGPLPFSAAEGIAQTVGWMRSHG